MPALSSFFLGPGAENAAALERLVAQALEGHFSFRRRLHPSGESRESSDGGISEHEALLSRELAGLLSQLSGSVPFFSPRHLGHMVSDVTLASLIGHLATLLYNPNNVAAEGGPVTTRLEAEVIAQLAKMLGYPEASHWGHLTSGGTLANLEALWAARTARYLPLSLRWVAEDHGQTDLLIKTASGARAPLGSLSLWDLLNVPIGAAIDAANALGHRLGATSSKDPRIGRHLMSQLGMTAFARRVEERFGSVLPAEVVLAPATAHYSWQKSCRVLGIGADRLLSIPVDQRFRMKTEELEAAVRELAARGQPVLACVPVVGSTEQSAIDPLAEIVAVRRRLSSEVGAWFWLHADAAWGGYALSAIRKSAGAERVAEASASPAPSDEDARRQAQASWPGADLVEALEAVGEMDSVTVDPHKFGFAPFSAGALCYRDGRVRYLLSSSDAPYAFQDEASARTSIGSHTLEGSRPGAAAASVWLSHRVLPLDASGHGRLIKASAQGARRLGRLLRDRDWRPLRVAMLPPADLNVVCFALGHPRLTTLEQNNAFVASLHTRWSLGADRSAARPEFIVSQTLLRASTYGSAALPLVAQLGFSEADYGRAGGVHLLRCTVIHPHHAEAAGGEDYLQKFVDRLHAHCIDQMKVMAEEVVAG